MAHENRYVRMRAALAERIMDAYATPRWRRTLSAAFFFLLFLPSVFLGYLDYRRTYDGLTTLTVDRRQALAYLAAATLKERLDRVTDLGVSLASRIAFRDDVEAGRWDAAMRRVNEAPKLFPDIERVVLFEPDATLRADSLVPSTVIGQNFAHRDWFKGVSKEWKPYVSEVYRRTGEPARNVVAVVSPIRSNADGRVIGILSLQITLDTFFKWSEGIDVGDGGFAYFVDQYGHLVAHPRFDVESQVVDFSSVPAVQRTLSGSSGLEISYNPVEKEERLTAFRQVPGYGWGVIVTQSVAQAFAARDEALQGVLISDAVYLTLLAAMILAVLMILSAALRFRTAAQRANAELAAIVANAEDAIVGRSLDGIITSWNKGAERVYGWKAEEVLGKPIIMIAPEELEGEMRKILERVRKDKPIEHYETQRLRKDGKIIDVSLSVSAIRDEHGEIVGSSAVARDVTERKQLDRQKSEFIFIASHQLRTPLTAIKWFLEMLLAGDAGKLQETQEKFLKNAFESNERMIDLINDLLSVSRIESGTIELVPVPTNVSEMLKGVVEENMPLAAEKKVTLELFPAELPRVEIDPKLVRQVFMNLISNAIKYTPSGGTVRVTAGQDGAFLTFSVKDTGIGIPPDEVPLLFTKFFRATNAAKSDAEGTGLGLYVVKRIVELSGGSLSFTTALGQGSSFTFTLPVEGSAPRRRATAKKPLS